MITRIIAVTWAICGITAIVATIVTGDREFATQAIIFSVGAVILSALVEKKDKQ